MKLNKYQIITILIITTIINYKLTIPILAILIITKLIQKNNVKKISSKI